MLETLVVPDDSVDSLERCDQIRHQLLQEDATFFGRGSCRIAQYAVG